MPQTVRRLTVRAMSEDADSSTITVHNIIILKKTCLNVKEMLVVGCQARRVACVINFLLTSV